MGNLGPNHYGVWVGADRHEPDPPKTDVELTRYMLAMWVCVGLRQIERLDEAVDKYRQAAAAAAFRAVHRGRSSAEWEPIYHQSTDAVTLADYWQMGAERYFLLLALAQVRKCVLAFPDDNLPHVREMKALRFLRDIDEHWEQAEGRSLMEMRQTRSDVEAGKMWFNNKHVWIGDVDTGELTSWLVGIDRVVRERSAQHGRRIPDPGTTL